MFVIKSYSCIKKKGSKKTWERNLFYKKNYECKRAAVFTKTLFS